MEIDVGIEVVVLTTTPDYDQLMVLLEKENSKYKICKFDLKQKEIDELLKESILFEDYYSEQLYTFTDFLGNKKNIRISYLVLANFKKIKSCTKGEFYHLKCINSKLENYVFEKVDSGEIITERDFDGKSYNLIKLALNRLKNKVSYTNVGFELLSENFTLLQVQKVYELLLQKEVVKQNFRRDIKKMLVLKDDELSEGSSGRPAALYALKKE